MKIRSSNVRARNTGKSEGKAKVDKTEGHQRIEAVDEVDQVDRFEVSEESRQRQVPEGDELAEETTAMLEQAMDDPATFRGAQMPALIGLDAMSSGTETTLTGLMALVDSEGD